MPRKIPKDLQNKKNENSNSNQEEKENDDDIELENENENEEAFQNKVMRKEEALDRLFAALTPDSEDSTKKFDLERFSKVLEKDIGVLLGTGEENTEDLARLTDLDSKTITALTLFKTLSDYYDLPSIKIFELSYFKLRISNDRQGRLELKDIAMMLTLLHQTDIVANGQNPYAANMLSSSPFPQTQNTTAFNNQNNPIVKKKKKFIFF